MKKILIILILITIYGCQVGLYNVEKIRVIDCLGFPHDYEKPKSVFIKGPVDGELQITDSSGEYHYYKINAVVRAYVDYKGKKDVVVYEFKEGKLHTRVMERTDFYWGKDK